MTQQTAPPAPAPIESPRPPAVATSGPRQGTPPQPYPETARGEVRPPVQPVSVIQVLRVGRPASGQFWVGLSLLGLVLLCCPFAAGAAVFGIEGPTEFIVDVLLIGACVLLVIIVFALILMVVGRPRRAQ